MLADTETLIDSPSDAIDYRLTPSNLALNGTGKKAKRSQLLVIQRAMMSLSLDQTAKASERAACARTFCEIQEQLRILDGELKPGSYNAHSKEMPKPKQRKAKAGILKTYPAPDQSASGPVVEVQAKPSAEPLVSVTPPPVVDQAQPKSTLEPQDSKAIEPVIDRC